MCHDDMQLRGPVQGDNVRPMSVTEGQNPPPPSRASALHSAPTVSTDSASSEADVLLPLLVEATAGEYEILGELGRGGMAAVYLARDLALNRKVAIKTMLSEFIGRQAMVQRFKREAQMAAGLSHPHIVQIHSVKQTNRIVYFVMKFLEGRGLDSIITEHGALELDMTRLILQQAASALSFAHHRGVIHRDVKPANIMIDENGWAVMTDFGIAKVDDGSNLTATGTAIGTPHYMAPEQFHNQPLTAAADQYALAIVAYEMLTGKKPFDGNTLAEIITQHLFSPPPDIRQDRPDLPASVSETLVHMLAKEPAARFPDLDAAIAALGAPDPARIDAVRGRLVSIARSIPAKKPRLSVPLSPMPATRPSAPTSVVGGAPRSAAPTAPGMASRTQRRATLWAIGIVALLVVVVGVGVGRRQMINKALPERNAALRRGVQLWQQGNPAAAVPEFTAAAQQLPKSAMPHVYLSRLARERGDLATAFNEAARGAELEPRNVVALREVGAVLLARSDFEGARRFLVRAVRANPRDAASMGWLACSLHRLGDEEQAARWSTRAGPGSWTSCLR
jgi:eukaryotic-like serine/threonine-protein kinase